MRQLKITKQVTNRETASLDKYLQEIGKVDLITADEEVELAQKIKAGDQKAVEKVEFVDSFSVYPNPVSDILKINSSDSATINAIEITDLNGRVVISEKMNGANDAQISVNNLSQGVYIIVCSNTIGLYICNFNVFSVIKLLFNI